MKFSNRPLDIRDETVNITFKKDKSEGQLNSGNPSDTTEFLVDAIFQNSNNLLLQNINTYPEESKSLNLFIQFITDKNNNKESLLKAIDRINQKPGKEKRTLLKNQFNHIWTSRAKNELLPSLFSHVVNSVTEEESIDEAKRQYIKYIENKKNKIVKSLKNNKILYAIETDQENQDIITPQTTSGKILQELTKAIKKDLNPVDDLEGNKNSGKAILDKQLKPAITIVVNEFFKQNQDKKDTKVALLTRGQLNIDQEKLLSENNLIYLCYEALEQFLNKSNKQQYISGIDYSKERKYRNKLKRNIRGIIHNKLTSQAIEAGRILFYYKQNILTDTEINIEVLQRVKALETYFKNLLDAVTFSYNSLKGKLDKCVVSDKDRSIVFNADFLGGIPKQFKDIYFGKLDPLNELFLPLEHENLENNNGLVQVIIKYVQTIRNNVAHYKIDLEQHKEKKTLESDIRNNQIISDKTNTAIERKISQLGKDLAEKFKTNNLFKYYNQNDLESVFRQVKFNFIQHPTVFPSFGKVLYRAKNSTTIINSPLVQYLRDLNTNTNTTSDDVEKAQSCKYLLQNIYKHYFQYKTDETLYNELMAFITNLEIQASVNENNAIKKEYYTKIIPMIKKQSTFQDVLTVLHIEERRLVQSKRKESDKGNFIDTFRLDFFGYMFFKTMPKEFYNLKPRKEQKNQERTYDNITKLIVSNINFDNLKDEDGKRYKKHLYKWFIFISLLDNQIISDINQQTHSYLSFVSKAWFESGQELEQTPTKLKEVMQLFSIFLHCNQEQSLLASKNRNTQKRHIKWLKTNFIDENLLQDQMEGVYIQGKKDHPITHNNIFKIDKYFSLPLITQAIQATNTRVTAQNLTDYKENKGKISDKIMENKRLRNNIKDYKDEISVQKYRKNIEFISEYQELSDKILLYNVKKLNHIVMAIHSRYVRYMQKLERDAIFTEFFVNGKFKNRKIRKNTEKILDYKEDEGFENIDKTTQFLLRLEDKSEAKSIRNSISHYALLTRDRLNNGDNVSKSFMDVFNDVRSLMAYDRNALNALPLIFKNVFKKYNIDIHFEFKDKGKNRDGETLVIQSLTSKKKTYLSFQSKSSFEMDCNSQDFLDQLEYLLTHNPHKKN